MIPFISKKDATVTINGLANNAEKTIFDDGQMVQLRRARTEESGYNWFNKTITHVIAQKIIIHDDIDVDCLGWFIMSKIHIDFSNAIASLQGLKFLILKCEDLKKKNIKVQEGSSIRIPKLQGMSGYSRCQDAQMACQNIGFKVFMT